MKNEHHDVRVQLLQELLLFRRSSTFLSSTTFGMSEGVMAVDSFVQGMGEQCNLANKDIEMMRFNDRKIMADCLFVAMV
jgi:hypothetical protein